MYLPGPDYKPGPGKDHPIGYLEKLGYYFRIDIVPKRLDTLIYSCARQGISEYMPELI